MLDPWTWAAIVGGGVLTPAFIITQERYRDGTVNYYVAFEHRGETMLSWVLGDDLIPLEVS